MQTSQLALQPQSWIGRWNQFSRHLRRVLGEQYATAGLPESTAFVLEAVATATTHLTQADLARELNISESSLCGLVERMRQEGLLQRERSWKDRRKSVLTLTPAGEEAYRMISQIHEELDEQLLASLTSEHRQQLSHLLDMLLHQNQDPHSAPEPSLRRMAS